MKLETLTPSARRHAPPCSPRPRSPVRSSRRLAPFELGGRGRGLPSDQHSVQEARATMQTCLNPPPFDVQAGTSNSNESVRDAPCAEAHGPSPSRRRAGLLRLVAPSGSTYRASRTLSINTDAASAYKRGSGGGGDKVRIVTGCRGAAAPAVG